MSEGPALDLVIRNVRVVRPHDPQVRQLDLGVTDGRFARIAPEIPAANAREVFDGRGLLGFPGVIDAHTHVGIETLAGAIGDRRRLGWVSLYMTIYFLTRRSRNQTGPAPPG